MCSIMVSKMDKSYKEEKDVNGNTMWIEYNYKGKHIYITKRWADKGDDYWGFYDEETGRDKKVIFKLC